MPFYAIRPQFLGSNTSTCRPELAALNGSGLLWPTSAWVAESRGPALDAVARCDNESGNSARRSAKPTH